MPDIFALVDCNNFYVSCERIFDPSIQKKPVIVLSNNDGCVIARSDETKKLGIKMGVPAFEVRSIIKKNEVKVFSTNYALYGDISERVMSLLSKITPEIEIYSIDEAFLDFSHISNSKLEDKGKEVVKMVQKNTGIPVSVGIAPTKTLAKAANYLAKTHHSKEGNYCLLNEVERELQLQSVPINEVWGVGEKYNQYFKRTGIFTAFDLMNADENRIRDNLGIMGQRIVLELRGKTCYPLNDNPDLKKEICTSRSFGFPLKTLSELEEATATYVSLAALKLRKQKSLANSLLVFIMTNKYASGPRYVNYRIVKLPSPTNQTQELIHFAQIALKSLFRKGYLYKKSGVIISDIVPSANYQSKLWEPSSRNKNNLVIAAMDAINNKVGIDAVKFAIQGLSSSWKMRQNNLSPHYTTNWKEILEVDMDSNPQFTRTD
ncbi:MAG: Y-family DNA polymerase [Bacteroidales bacterium]|nr:Y-family DNA polymerase [Bacteroidales bacterium]MCF8403202.1 Y-family DNA polymerase [Bacteroidales bacterium]